MYIVTGGAGFLGSAMVWKLNKMGITNIVIVDNLASTEKWKNLVNLRYEDYIQRDAFFEKLERGLHWDIEGVIHMGACSSTTERNADFLMHNNFHFSCALCAHALKQGARFIGASSAATYGDGSQGFSDALDLVPKLKPLNMYGYSKQLFDLWAMRHGALSSIASLKFFNVYGPNEYHKDDMRSVICKSFHQINENGTIQLFRSARPEYEDGGQMRDFVYVKDCIELIGWLLEHPQTSGIFNVGAGKARTWNDLARAVFSAMNKDVNINYIDMPEHLKGKYQYFTEAPMAWLAERACPVRFRSLEEGVQDYVQKYLLNTDPYLGNE